MISEKSLKNLRPFKKGQSGNPKGIPKGYVRMSTLMKLALCEDIDFEYPNGKVVRIPRSQAIIYNLLEKAASKDSDSLGAIKEVFDRTDGKALQISQTDITTDGKKLEIIFKSEDIEENKEN